MRNPTRLPLRGAIVGAALVATLTACGGSATGAPPSSWHPPTVTIVRGAALPSPAPTTAPAPYPTAVPTPYPTAAPVAPWSSAPLPTFAPYVPPTPWPVITPTPTPPPASPAQIAACDARPPAQSPTEPGVFFPYVWLGGADGECAPNGVPYRRATP